MPTRRDFLQSALLLPAALTRGKAFAQDTPKLNAAPITEVFADFESGNYDGWTIEGDAFGTAPATDALFPGKIRGFTGRGFLCSLHPRKGNAATCKAISKEFTIEKPFLTFKIGGGNHPNQACLNLIVDGKIVRTATGNGTATLSESSFDVSNLIGRKAHIEIVDATDSADRGYIMVDDIQFADVPRAENQDGFSEGYYFIKHSVFETNTTLSKMETTAKAFQKMDDEVCTAVYWNCGLYEIDQDERYTPAERLLRLSTSIRGLVDNYLAERRLTGKPQLLKQWLFSKACCAYVVSNLDYDWDILRLPNDERKALSTSEVILAQPAGHRKAMCVGFAVLCRDLVRSGGKDLGVKANFVGSFWRDLGQEASLTSNHAFVCFEMDGGLIVPAELTTPRMNRKDFQTRATAPREDFVMPLSPEARELFLARNYGADETPPKVKNMGDEQNLYPLSTLSLTEWKSAQTEQLKPLDARMIKQFDSRAKWLKVG
jgi:hypothetical protein